MSFSKLAPTHPPLVRGGGKATRSTWRGSRPQTGEQSVMGIVDSMQSGCLRTQEGMQRLSKNERRPGFGAIGRVEAQISGSASGPAGAVNQSGDRASSMMKEPKKVEKPKNNNISHSTCKSRAKRGKKLVLVDASSSTGCCPWRRNPVAESTRSPVFRMPEKDFAGRILPRFIRQSYESAMSEGDVISLTEDMKQRLHRDGWSVVRTFAAHSHWGAVNLALVQRGSGGVAIVPYSVVKNQPARRIAGTCLIAEAFGTFMLLYQLREDQRIRRELRLSPVTEPSHVQTATWPSSQPLAICSPAGISIPSLQMKLMGGADVSLAYTGNPGIALSHKLTRISGLVFGHAEYLEDTVSTKVVIYLRGTAYHPEVFHQKLCVTNDCLFGADVRPKDVIHLSDIKPLTGGKLRHEHRKIGKSINLKESTRAMCKALPAFVPDPVAKTEDALLPYFEKRAGLGVFCSFLRDPDTFVPSEENVECAVGYLREGIQETPFLDVLIGRLFCSRRSVKEIHEPLLRALLKIWPELPKEDQSLLVPRVLPAQDFKLARLGQLEEFELAFHSDIGKYAELFKISTDLYLGCGQGPLLPGRYPDYTVRMVLNFWRAIADKDPKCWFTTCHLYSHYDAGLFQSLLWKYRVFAQANEGLPWLPGGSAEENYEYCLCSRECSRHFQPEEFVYDSLFFEHNRTASEESLEEPQVQKYEEGSQKFTTHYAIIAEAPKGCWLSARLSVPTLSFSEVKTVEMVELQNALSDCRELLQIAEDIFEGMLGEALGEVAEAVVNAPYEPMVLDYQEVSYNPSEGEALLTCESGDEPMDWDGVGESMSYTCWVTHGDADSDCRGPFCSETASRSLKAEPIPCVTELTPDGGIVRFYIGEVGDYKVHDGETPETTREWWQPPVTTVEDSDDEAVDDDCWGYTDPSDWECWMYQPDGGCPDCSSSDDGFVDELDSDAGDLSEKILVVQFSEQVDAENSTAVSQILRGVEAPSQQGEDNPGMVQETDQQVMLTAAHPAEQEQGTVSDDEWERDLEELERIEHEEDVQELESSLAGFNLEPAVSTPVLNLTPEAASEDSSCVAYDGIHQFESEEDMEVNSQGTDEEHQLLGADLVSSRTNHSSMTESHDVPPISSVAMGVSPGTVRQSHCGNSGDMQVETYTGSVIQHFASELQSTGQITESFGGVGLANHAVSIDKASTVLMLRPKPASIKAEVLASVSTGCELSYVVLSKQASRAASVILDSSIHGQSEDLLHSLAKAERVEVSQTLTFQENGRETALQLVQLTMQEPAPVVRIAKSIQQVCASRFESSPCNNSDESLLGVMDCQEPVTARLVCTVERSAEKKKAPHVMMPIIGTAGEVVEHLRKMGRNPFEVLQYEANVDFTIEADDPPDSITQEECGGPLLDRTNRGHPKQSDRLKRKTTASTSKMTRSDRCEATHLLRNQGSSNRPAEVCRRSSASKGGSRSAPQTSPVITRRMRKKPVFFELTDNGECANLRGFRGLPCHGSPLEQPTLSTRDLADYRGRKRKRSRSSSSGSVSSPERFQSLRCRQKRFRALFQEQCATECEPFLKRILKPFTAALNWTSWLLRVLWLNFLAFLSPMPKGLGNEYTKCSLDSCFIEQGKPDQVPRKSGRLSAAGSYTSISDVSEGELSEGHLGTADEDEDCHGGVPSVELSEDGSSSIVFGSGPRSCSVSSENGSSDDSDDESNTTSRPSSPVPVGEEEGSDDSDSGASSDSFFPTTLAHLADWANAETARAVLKWLIRNGREHYKKCSSAAVSKYLRDHDNDGSFLVFLLIGYSTPSLVFPVVAVSLFFWKKGLLTGYCPGVLLPLFGAAALLGLENIALALGTYAAVQKFAVFAPDWYWYGCILPLSFCARAYKRWLPWCLLFPNSRTCSVAWNSANAHITTPYDSFTYAVVAGLCNVLGLNMTIFDCITCGLLLTLICVRKRLLCFTCRNINLLGCAIDLRCTRCMGPQHPISAYGTTIKVCGSEYCERHNFYCVTDPKLPHMAPPLVLRCMLMQPGVNDLYTVECKDTPKGSVHDKKMVGGCVYGYRNATELKVLTLRAYSASVVIRVRNVAKVLKKGVKPEKVVGRAAMDLMNKLTVTEPALGHITLHFKPHSPIASDTLTLGEHNFGHLDLPDGVDLFPGDTWLNYGVYPTALVGKCLKYALPYIEGVVTKDGFSPKGEFVDIPRPLPQDFWDACPLDVRSQMLSDGYTCVGSVEERLNEQSGAPAISLRLRAVFACFVLVLMCGIHLASKQRCMTDWCLESRPGFTLLGVLLGDNRAQHIPFIGRWLGTPLTVFISYVLVMLQEKLLHIKVDPLFLALQAMSAAIGLAYLPMMIGPAVVSIVVLCTGGPVLALQGLLLCCPLGMACLPQVISVVSSITAVSLFGITKQSFARVSHYPMYLTPKVVEEVLSATGVDPSYLHLMANEDNRQGELARSCIKVMSDGVPVRFAGAVFRPQARSETGPVDPRAVKISSGGVMGSGYILYGDGEEVKCVTALHCVKGAVTFVEFQKNGVWQRKQAHRVADQGQMSIVTILDASLFKRERFLKSSDITSEMLRRAFYCSPRGTFQLAHSVAPSVHDSFFLGATESGDSGTAIVVDDNDERVVIGVHQGVCGPVAVRTGSDGQYCPSLRQAAQFKLTGETMPRAWKGEIPINFKANWLCVLTASREGLREIGELLHAPVAEQSVLGIAFAISFVWVCAGLRLLAHRLPLLALTALSICTSTADPTSIISLVEVEGLDGTKSVAYEVDFRALLECAFAIGTVVAFASVSARNCFRTSLAMLLSYCWQSRVTFVFVPFTGMGPHAALGVLSFAVTVDLTRLCYEDGLFGNVEHVFADGYYRSTDGGVVVEHEEYIPGSRFHAAITPQAADEMPELEESDPVSDIGFDLAEVSKKEVHPNLMATMVQIALTLAKQASLKVERIAVKKKDYGLIRQSGDEEHLKALLRKADRVANKSAGESRKAADILKILLQHQLKLSTLFSGKYVMAESTSGLYRAAEEAGREIEEIVQVPTVGIYLAELSGQCEPTLLVQQAVCDFQEAVSKVSCLSQDHRKMVGKYLEQANDGYVPVSVTVRKAEGKVCFEIKRGPKVLATSQPIEENQHLTIIGGVKFYSKDPLTSDAIRKIRSTLADSDNPLNSCRS